MTKWTAFFVAVLGLGSTCLSQDKQAGTPIFTAGSNFVQVPVIVQRSGKHVSGLKKDVFVLRQDGKDQVIATFEEIRTGESGRGAQTQAQFGNEAAQVPQQITVIALDTVNTPNLDRTYFIQELERYLTRPGKFEGPIGLVAIERSGIRIMTGFTNDPRLIMAAIREHADSAARQGRRRGDGRNAGGQCRRHLRERRRAGGVWRRRWAPAI